jgi:O-antigen ligase
MYKDGEYHLFGNVQKVYADNLVLQIDYNSSWRAILWYRSLVEKFPENLLGIGFGTPILEYKEKRNSADSDYDDEHDAHVIGMHNTYITLFVRLGIFYLFIIILIFNCVFKEFYRYRNYYFQVNQIRIFLFFFSVAIIGLFNLIKESPIGASLFWVSLGFVAKAIENRKSYFRLLTSSS